MSNSTGITRKFTTGTKVISDKWTWELQWCEWLIQHLHSTDKELQICSTSSYLLLFSAFLDFLPRKPGLKLIRFSDGCRSWAKGEGERFACPAGFSSFCNVCFFTKNRRGGGRGVPSFPRPFPYISHWIYKPLIVCLEVTVTKWMYFLNTCYLFCFFF